MTGMMTETQENPVKSSVHASFIFIYEGLYETYQVNTYIKNIKKSSQITPFEFGDMAFFLGGPTAQASPRPESGPGY